MLLEWQYFLVCLQFFSFLCVLRINVKITQKRFPECKSTLVKSILTWLDRWAGHIFLPLQSVMQLLRQDLLTHISYFWQLQCSGAASRMWNVFVSWLVCTFLLWTWEPEYICSCSHFALSRLTVQALGQKQSELCSSMTMTRIITSLRAEFWQICGVQKTTEITISIWLLIIIYSACFSKLRLYNKMNFKIQINHSQCSILIRNY